MPDLPSATTTLAGLQQWSNPMFQALLPYGYLAGGVLIGVGLIGFVIYIGSLISHHLSSKNHQ